MFRFFHTYHPRTWEATVKAGFVGENDGIRCMHHIYLKDEEKFNSVMKKGSALRNLLEENNMPFYFDRLQGGIFFDGEYRYDMELFKEVKDTFKERFWGFQIHEWGSNYGNDWFRLKDQGLVGCTPEKIRKVLDEKFGTLFTWVESQSVEEFAEMLPPESGDELVQHMKMLYKKRSDAFDNMLLPADSYFFTPKIEIENGARRLMPEVGAQIGNMRIQMAYTRGMAKAHGIPWGIYYEPWGGRPFSFGTASNNMGLNEWNLASNGKWIFEMHGENGGSSRSLQDRIFRYSFFSGASFISEEWGLCNTFIDWDDFELSKYGKIKLDFLNSVRSGDDRGTSYTPFAIVLPTDFEVMDMALFIDDGNDGYLGFPKSDRKRLQCDRIAEVLGMIFGNEIDGLGNETYIIKNGGMPDVFDIINADNEKALENYEYLIDLTGDSGFAAKHKNIVEVQNITEVLKKILPCWVDGGLHWMINRVDGGYRLIIINNNGIERSVAIGDRLIPEATKTAEIICNKTVRPVFGKGYTFNTDGEKSYVTISAGGYMEALF